MRNKKTLLMFVLLCCFFFVSNGIVKKDKIKTIEITTANFMINSHKIMNVTCNGLEQQFMCASFYIDNKKEQDMILDGIKNAERVSTYDQAGIDTRVRLNLIYQSGKTVEVCFGLSPIFMLNGQAMRLTDMRVVNYLFSLRSELGRAYNEIRDTYIDNISYIEIIKDKYEIYSSVKYNLKYQKDTFFIKDVNQQKLILSYIDSARVYLAFKWTGIDTVKSTIYINYKSGVSDELNFGTEQFFYLNREFWKLSSSKLLNYLNALKH